MSRCCLVLMFVVSSDCFLLKSSTVKIASFNLRRYSVTKATSNPQTNTYIAKILLRYEMIFLQEIIDLSKENRVVSQLLSHLHKQSKSIKYESIISPPLGSTSYKERLVYLVRTKPGRVQILSSHVYNGSVSHLFERSPFILHVKLSKRSSRPTIFIGVHLKPDAVYEEFRHLRTVIDELPPKSSVVLLGDFNADCSYLNNVKKKELRKSYFQDFHWLIDDRTETNLLESCSYDRILVSAGKTGLTWKSNSNGTFPFDKHFRLSKEAALQVSDHYPVEVEFI